MFRIRLDVVSTGIGARARRFFAAGALVLAAAVEVPPYSWQDADGSFHGIDIEIARAAAKRLDCTLEIRPMPFMDIFPALKSGKADFAAGAITITEGRARDVDFSSPYAVDGAAFLYRAGETVPTMITAERLRIGAVDSMTHDFYLARHGIDPYRYKTYADAVVALRAGHVDAVFFEGGNIDKTVEKSAGKFARTPLETREFYGIPVRKGFSRLLEAVDGAISDMKRAGDAKGAE